MIIVIIIGIKKKASSLLFHEFQRMLNCHGDPVFLFLDRKNRPKGFCCVQIKEGEKNDIVVAIYRFFSISQLNREKIFLECLFAIYEEFKEEYGGSRLINFLLPTRKEAVLQGALCPHLSLPLEKNFFNKYVISENSCKAEHLGFDIGRFLSLICGGTPSDYLDDNDRTCCYCLLKQFKSNDGIECGNNAALICDNFFKKKAELCDGVTNRVNTIVYRENQLRDIIFLTLNYGGEKIYYKRVGNFDIGQNLFMGRLNYDWKKTCNVFLNIDYKSIIYNFEDFVKFFFESYKKKLSVKDIILLNRGALIDRGFLIHYNIFDLFVRQIICARINLSEKCKFTKELEIKKTLGLYEMCESCDYSKPLDCSFFNDLSSLLMFFCQNFFLKEGDHRKGVFRLPSHCLDIVFSFVFQSGFNIFCQQDIKY
jgi:hypothetical protein